MTSKKELQLAYGMAIILLVIGGLCYAAFPLKAPEEPLRIAFQCTAGKVMYDHKTHTAESGYGIACSDCHHHPQGDQDTRACGQCHQIPADGAVPAACNDCHAPDEIAGSEMMKASDAFHSQCIGCHKKMDAGPQECASCHYMK